MQKYYFQVYDRARDVIVLETRYFDDFNELLNFINHDLNDINNIYDTRIIVVDNYGEYITDIIYKKEEY